MEEAPLPAKRARHVYVPTLVEKERNERYAAIRASKATALEDARRRNILQLAAMAKRDSELPELQEDLATVNYICRFSNWKETGDRDLKLITEKRKLCDICFEADKDARFVTAEAATNKGEDHCPHAFCFRCAYNHIFGATAIAARTPQYQATPPARCPFCRVVVVQAVKIEFLADSRLASERDRQSHAGRDAGWQLHAPLVLFAYSASCIRVVSSSCCVFVSCPRGMLV